MTRSSWLAAAVLLFAGIATAVACGSSGKTSPGPADATAGDAKPGDAQATADAGCTTCTTDSQCDGGICVTLGGANYCAVSCNTSATCGSDEQCTPVESATSGSQVGACVPRGGICGQLTMPTSDGGGSVDGGCGALLGPDASAMCTCPTGKSCQTNGCRYGEWCDPQAKACTPAPIGCGSPGAVYDAGAPPTGSVGPDGGTVSRLYFAVVGDTRPASEDDTAGYPTAVITRIFTDMEALTPRPTFAVSSGDYQYANPTGTQGAAQQMIYLGARKIYSGTVFPAMGNHECTGFTASNCGDGGVDGITNNYAGYMQNFVAPLGQTNPYYEIDIDGTGGAWTSKFLFLAANAWDQTQANWLAAAMGKTTTYTFLIRHEPAASDTAPGVSPAETIMSMHPYTLSIVGHDHEYVKSGAREVTIGNGGAPLTGTGDYGYGMVSQQSDGTIAIDMIDYSSGLADPAFHFAVNPNGSAAQ